MTHVDTAYCPHCRIITNLNMSTVLRPVAGKDGKIEMVVSKTYHCTSCSSFVYSEDEEKSFRN